MPFQLERLVNSESLSITEKPELAPLDRLAEQYAFASLNHHRLLLLFELGGECGVVGN